jgi:hypothetical protein
MGPGGSLRQDWVPAEQPPSPDGTSGRWHLVSALAGAQAHWEWHPDPVVPAPQVQRPVRTKPRVPQDLTSNLRRGCIAAVVMGVLMPWATLGPFAITGLAIKDGKLLMAIALGALAVSLAPRHLAIRLVDVLLALSAFVAAMIDAGSAATLVAKVPGVLDVKVGSGLVVCVLASGAWLASLVWEQGSRIRGRRRSRRAGYTPPAWFQPGSLIDRHSAAPNG